MLHHWQRLTHRLRGIFFGPAYHPADHSALQPRGGRREVRQVLVVVGSIWLTLVAIDSVGRLWEHKPKSFWVFTGANALNRIPNLRHEPWPLEGNLARILSVSELARPYWQQEDTTARWLTTDSYGYRLGTSRPPYQVVLCGDSFFDNDVIADSLARFSRLPVGNMAIDGRGALTMTRFLVTAPPEYQQAKVVVWGKVESAIIRTEFEDMDGQLRELKPSSRLKNLKHSWEQSLLWPLNIDLYLTESSTLKRIFTLGVNEATWQVAQTHSPETILGRQDLAAGQAPMLFRMYETGLLDPIAEADLVFIADKIAAVDQELRQRGVTLYFTAIPDKSVVYRERLPADRPFRGHNEPRLYRLLRARGVRTITVSEGLRQAALADPARELYYSTDTHWNSRGQTLAARIIADSLQSAAGK